VTTKLVIIGGGPGGNAAASWAARLGADVTMVEREIVGGAAHLLDCIPSKAMIATGGAMSATKRFEGMGIDNDRPVFDVDTLAGRIQGIVGNMRDSTTRLLESQGVNIVMGDARFTGSHEVEVTGSGGTTRLGGDAFVIATGSRPRIPAWVVPDGDRILTTRDCYPPRVFPESVVVVGSGVTGVEFVHMFASFGAAVTLVVSRQQVLPGKDAEAAAALEDRFLASGVKLLKGARATAVTREGDGVLVQCDDGRQVRATHSVLAIGSEPNVEGLGLDAAGVALDARGYIAIDARCRTNLPHIYAAGDVSGRLPLSSVASMQGRKIAEYVMGVARPDSREVDYDKAASAIFTQPEIADVGLAEADAFSSGRKIRVTKVPFSSSAKALIHNDPHGFVKLISDPNTGVVLGGTVVGRHAAELVSVVALAVTAHLRVSDLLDSLLVHPSLAESLSEAAE
jgi:pyruvate/2-oxoglutarate dehydrogenase complex dihydrolipoamide dehydrogenase (E3) component